MDEKATEEQMDMLEIKETVNSLVKANGDDTDKC